MSSLFQLTGRMLDIKNAYEAGREYIDDETGEVVDNHHELEAMLDEALEAEGLKVDAYISLIRSWELDIKSIDDEKKRLDKLKKRRQSGIKDLMRRIENELVRSGRDQLSCALGVFKFSGRKSVDVVEVTHLSKEYIREKVTVLPDKKAIAAALKKGIEVSGARWADAKLVLK